MEISDNVLKCGGGGGGGLTEGRWCCNSDGWSGLRLMSNAGGNRDNELLAVHLVSNCHC